MEDYNQTLLPKSKNVNAVNVDQYMQISLTNKISRINQFDINKVVKASDVFDEEREKNVKYNLYGRIEYLSLLNGIPKNYETVEDIFNPTEDENPRTLENSFDFYLVKPNECVEIKDSSPFQELNSENIKKYIRKFKVIATPKDIKIMNAGFSKNMFDEQIYLFILNKTLDF